MSPGRLGNGVPVVPRDQGTTNNQASLGDSGHLVTFWKVQVKGPEDCLCQTPGRRPASCE
jgi:hypothetical protein